MTDNLAPVVARQMWRTLEPVHGMVYFAPEAPAAFEKIGLDDPGAGYFASRSAPMGAVPAPVVIAPFFNFHPDLVRRAIPRSWDRATPEDFVAARLSAADAALRRLLGDVVESAEMAEAATLARQAATAPGMLPDGRPLYAGHASLDWPSEPHLVVWHAITLLREYRGDGHIAALVASDITGLEALVLHAGTGEVPRDVLQQTRGWDDAEWGAALALLQRRGWVAEDGGLTEAGRAHRDWVEERTDIGATAPWTQLGPHGCRRLRELVRPWSRTIVAAGVFGGQPENSQRASAQPPRAQSAKAPPSKPQTPRASRAKR